MTWSKEILKKLEKEGRIKTVHIPKEPKNKVKIQNFRNRVGSLRRGS